MQKLPINKKACGMADSYKFCIKCLRNNIDKNHKIYGNFPCSSNWCSGYIENSKESS